MELSEFIAYSYCGLPILEFKILTNPLAKHRLSHLLLLGHSNTHLFFGGPDVHAIKWGIR